MHYSPIQLSPTPYFGSAIENLRQQLSRFTSSGLIGAGALKLGLPEIEQALPGQGLARGALHEMAGDRRAITSFLAALLGHNPRCGEVLWVTPAANLDVPGLTQVGLDHRRLTVVSARRADDRLWSFDEGLSELGYGAVVAEIDNIDLAETHRLHRAARQSGGIGFLLRRDHSPSAAITRWHIDAAGSDSYRHCWRLRLEHCQGVETSHAWTVAWDDAAASFHLVAR